MEKAPWKIKILDFMTRERERLIGYVHRLIDDAAERDGEDIVQDVVLNLFTRADISIPIENITAYVYQALRNRVIDYLRKRKDTVSLDDGWSDDEETTLLQVLPDPQTNGADEVSRMEIRESLFEALSVLNDEQREILIATELEGKTFQELSEEWDIPLGTLLARKSRAIQKVRETIK
ncbi:MAG: sigma-70 family RNA polymerase sigma factor [Deltaproteobacteria bacterium]|nr:sigma-70 family RNA polymerase sigma factor [Deltaproteobacteria bacterium]